MSQPETAVLVIIPLLVGVLTVQKFPHSPPPNDSALALKTCRDAQVCFCPSKSILKFQDGDW